MTVQVVTDLRLPPAFHALMMAVTGACYAMSEQPNEQNAEVGNRPNLRDIVAAQHGIPPRPRHVRSKTMERNLYHAPPSAREQGQEDGRAGVSIADCPYREDTPDESEWLIGWGQTYRLPDN